MARMLAIFTGLVSANAHGHGHGHGGRSVGFRSAGRAEATQHSTLGYTTRTQTFRSDALPLSAGEVIFTDPTKTVLAFPDLGSSYAITEFHAEIVDENNQSVPLDEVYLHHWLVFNNKRPNQGVCGGFLDYTFGVGAETRGTPVKFPQGSGWVADVDMTWTANIHIMRTQDLAVETNQSQAVKSCIECLYAPGKPCSPSQSGQFDCCTDGSFCPTQGTITGKKNYYFSYTVVYTTDVAAIAPVYVYLLDASNCKIEHNIAANDVEPVKTTSFSWTSPVSGDIVFSVGHIHNAGINVSLAINESPVCTTTPIYGTEVGVPGNEKGYLVGNPGCEHVGKTNVGDKITVTSHYWVGTGTDPTGSGLPGGFHGGVMDYMYIAYSRDSLRDSHGLPIDNPSVFWSSEEGNIVV